MYRYSALYGNCGADAPPWRGRHGAQWLSLNNEFCDALKVWVRGGGLGEDAGGEVAFAGVGEEGDYGFVGVFGELGFAEGGGECGAG